MLPISAKDAHASPADHARCRQMLRVGSGSFNTAAKLLPQRLRDPITVFYAFCRLADDSVDHSRDKKASLERLKARVDQCYNGTPIGQPVDRAFTDLLNTRPMPRQIIDLLLEGFEWDTLDHRYRTISDVRAYSVRVASTVGAIVALLLNVRDRDTIDRACSLGVAMQLTNIARDVGEDANAHRLYLPTEWLINAGINPQGFLENPTPNPCIKDCVSRLLEEAQKWYRHAEVGIARLPRGARAGIYAARYIYAEIGRVIGVNGFDSVTTRAIVSRRRKLSLLLTSCAAATKPCTMRQHTGVPEAQTLVDIATTAANKMPAAPDLTDRMVWAASILARPVSRP